MFIPFGDEPNDSKRFPWMNYALIAANVLIFIVVVAPVLGSEQRAMAVLLKWGYVPSQPTTLTLFSSMFMHAGWLHLIGNMLFLWIFGDNIEARLGALGYLLAYLGVGAAATLIYGAFNAGATLPCVGASGAISGVQGLYFIACPKHRVKVFIWFYVFITVLRLPARGIMLFWFAWNDLRPVLFSLRAPGGGGVAHMAHLGGFAAGLLLMLLLRPLVKRVELAAAGESRHVDRYRSDRSRRYRSRPARHQGRPRPPRM